MSDDDTIEFNVGGLESLPRTRTVWRSVEISTCSCTDYYAFWVFYDIPDVNADDYWHWCIRVFVFNFNLKTGEIFLYDPDTDTHITDTVRTFDVFKNKALDNTITFDDTCFNEGWIDPETESASEICSFWFTPETDAVVDLLNDMIFDPLLPGLLDSGETGDGTVIALAIYCEFHRPYQLTAPLNRRNFLTWTTGMDTGSWDETDSLPKVIKVCYSATPPLIEKGPTCF